MICWANLALRDLLRRFMSPWIYCKHERLTGKLLVAVTSLRKLILGLDTSKLCWRVCCKSIKANEIYTLVIKIRMISYHYQSRKKNACCNLPLLNFKRHKIDSGLRCGSFQVGKEQWDVISFQHTAVVLQIPAKLMTFPSAAAVFHGNLCMLTC